MYVELGFPHRDPGQGRHLGGISGVGLLEYSALVARFILDLQRCAGSRVCARIIGAGDCIHWARAVAGSNDTLDTGLVEWRVNDYCLYGRQRTSKLLGPVDTKFRRGLVCQKRSPLRLFRPQSAVRKLCVQGWCQLFKTDGEYGPSVKNKSKKLSRSSCCLEIAIIPGVLRNPVLFLVPL